MYHAKKILLNLAAALVFGALFWYFLETVQPGLVHLKFACCDRCGNILYDVEKPILTYCAALAFFCSTFLKLRGWTVILKAFAISWLCFQIYFVMTFWSGIHYEECTALNYPRGLFPIIGAIGMEIETLIWAMICSAVFLVFNQCRKAFDPDTSNLISGIK